MPTYRLPPRFYDDHVERDCAAGVLVRRTSRAVYVDLDQASLDDLHSDAVYYSGLGAEAGFGGNFDNPWEQAIIASAQATVAALARGPVAHVPRAAAPRRPRVVKETMASYPKPCGVCGHPTYRRLTGDHAACLGHLGAVATDILGAPAALVARRAWKAAA